MSKSYREIMANGLWHNNAGFVQLLGLCPLLAVSNTIVNALGLAMATTLVLVISNMVVSASRNYLRKEIRIPAFVLVIASAVTAIELFMHAWFHDLYNILGIFIPLIVTNCAIIGRAEAFASRNSIIPSMLDGLATGLGFGLALVAVGFIRELIGQGTLLSQSHLLFGQGIDFTITVIHDYKGFLVAILPPGAFFALAFLIAGKNFYERRKEEAESQKRIEVEVRLG